MLLLLRAERKEKKELQLALDAKPKVEIVEKIIEKVVVKKVRNSGAVKVVEKIKREPGGVQYVDRIVYRDPVIYVEYKESEDVKESSHTETPAQLPCPWQRWILGGTINHWRHGRPLDVVHFGYSLGGRLDLLYGLGLDGSERKHGLTALWRF